MQRYRIEPPLVRRERVVELSSLEAAQRTDRVLLGRLAESGPTRNVWLDVSHEHVLAIVGKRGSGKSFTLGSFIEGLCTKESRAPISQISKSRGALLFDTLNIFQWTVAPVSGAPGSSQHVAEQARILGDWGLTQPIELEVDLWVPAGFESRVTTKARPFQIRSWDMEVADWAALLRVDAMVDIMGQLLTQVHDKVTRRGWTGARRVHQPPRAEYAIDDLLDCLANDPDIERDYTRETIRALRQRLSAYESSELFGMDGTPLAHLIHRGRLSVLLLSGIPDDLRLIIVSLTTRQLLFARAEASEALKTLELGFASDDSEQSRVRKVLEGAPPKTWVLIDEAQNIFPTERQTSATEILLRFVREGRNFGLSLGFTTQQPSAIDPRIMAQVDTMLVHTLTVQKDLQTVMSNLKSRSPESIYLRSSKIGLADAIRQLETGQAFVTTTEAPRGFFMDVRPRVSVHGGFEG